jgi:hypothetical protein
MEARLRPPVWLGEGVSGLEGFRLGWLDEHPWRR